MTFLELPSSAGSSVLTVALALTTGLADRAPAPAVQLPAAAPAVATKPTRPARSCAAKAASLPMPQAVGQLFMVAVSPNGMNPSTPQILRRNHVGSVILLGQTYVGMAGVQRATATARRAAGRPGGVGLLTAVDQEGGRVQRLQGTGFSRIPSAKAQGHLSNTSLRRNARVWGRQLHRAGVQMNLAPVADVVPPGLQNVNQPIGRLQRNYGTTPTRVAAKSAAVVSGYRSVGVATAAKHFPGLGTVIGNTDHVANVKDRTIRRHDRRLAGFTAAARQGSDAMMVSSATYTRIDSRRLALFSPTVMAMIRRDLRFRGVIVSDDVGATAALQGVSPGARATRFLGAGGDLVVNASPGLTGQMTSAVLTRARRDHRFAAGIRAKAARVLTMKAHHGLVACRP